MGEALMRAAAELAAFVEGSDDRTIDPDAAVQALEAFQGTLLEGSSPQELISYSGLLHQLRKEAEQAGDQGRAAFFASLADALRRSA